MFPCPRMLSARFKTCGRHRSMMPAVRQSSRSPTDDVAFGKGARYWRLFFFHAAKMTSAAALRFDPVLAGLLEHDPEKWEPVSRLREARFSGRRKVGKACPRAR